MSDPFSSSGGDDDSEEEESSTVEGFEGQLKTALDTGNVSALQVPAVREGLGEVEDDTLLKDVYAETGDENIEELIRDRLHELDSSVPMDNPEQTELDDTPEESQAEDVETMTEEAEVDIDVSDIAPGAMDPAEAKSTEKIWRVMVWGPPGVGKTHFAYTMPGPVCIIDTEGKADDIAHKFDKPFFVWKPQDYNEAVEALHESLDVLRKYQKEADKTGTIVVDSMSIMWNWSQEHYSQKYYDQSADEARDKFDSAFGGGQSDWQEIKRLHNKEFRRKMIESPFHVCWTAMSKKDYGAMLRENLDEAPDMPEGEKNNIYKVDHIVHIRQDETGVPVAEMEKSGLVKHRFEGLEYPSFDKLQETVYAIDEAENTPDPVDADEVSDYDINIVKGNPRFVRRSDE